MKKLLLLAALSGLSLGAQSIYVPDSGTALVETVSATDPTPGTCLFSLKVLNYTSGHQWGCVGTPGAQTWLDLTTLGTPATAAAPATSSSPGVTGTVAYDANYVYVCIAPSVWKRSPLTTF